jgi:hypothetical protein
MSSKVKGIGYFACLKLGAEHFDCSELSTPSLAVTSRYPVAL